jgi:2-keto-4-pentenoate hydratase/2-oxohepta-3-ene-1,7-dioic acid hydratase in catechol pathway
VTGTPGGVGAAREPVPLWMRPGDVCEVEIDGIGTLANPITQESGSRRSSCAGASWRGESAG